jgi:hypothetical protein
MHQTLSRGILSAAVLLQAAMASAQVADLRDLKPREVKSAVFTLAAPQDLSIDAAGAEAESRSGTFSWLTAMWPGKDEARREPWMGDAWILDLSSRKVVWELSAASTERGRRGTRTFSGTLRLPAGTYEAFYAAFPNIYSTDEDGGGAGERFLTWLADVGFEDFHLKIQGHARPLAGADADRARHGLEATTVVALRGDGPQRFAQAGFSLDRPTDVEISSTGEVREDAEFDAGWIINAETRQPVWKLTWADSNPAGGAQKNRSARLTRTLPAGRYAAFYATDDSHDFSAWNSAPPRDPHAWGLFLRVPEAARSAFHTFAYEHVPESATLVALTKVGDAAFKSRGFTLTRPTDVRVYALGEGSRNRMVDYAWITDAATRQKVWEMRYEETDYAGGDPKNRLADRVIRLEKGDYVLNYVSDGSHGYGDWNAAAPRDAQHWGVTLLAAHGAAERAAAFAEYAAKPDPSVIAQVVRVRDDERPRARFTLDREARVRIYAIGEASGRDLADYGWIEEAKSGRRVWEMAYRMTDAAGGAAKNRKFDGIVTLPAGDYTLRFETDGSHAFGAWNAGAPDDPEMWGITLYRVR